MKLYIAVLILIFSCIKSNAQSTDSLQPSWQSMQTIMPYRTSLKININGLRLGLEQRLSKHTSFQLEIGHLRKKQIILNPQFRWYKPLFKKTLAFIGIGYLYKHDEYTFSDSFSITGSSQHGYKQMSISKYIHAFTLHSGYFWQERIFKHDFLFEFNFAAGIRYKKSNRYGLNENEKMVWGEAYILRPQYEQDTEGKFILYPEITLTLRLIIPLRK